jgi:putative hydroxymethylpyrimidine transport system ATP-binding protein
LADQFEHPENTTRPLSIEIDAASISYEGRPLFEDFGFKLEAGHWTCLLGPSGVGKSSLLRIIAGLLPLERGEIRCGDQQTLKGRLAWMGQEDALLPWLSVEDNVLIGSTLRGLAKDREQARQWLREVGVHNLANRRPATLSGGQRQRVALARTLMEDRPVVLMDEPFSSLDAITRARLQELAATKLRGKTVLLVTHDPLEALRLGHQIYVMSGRPAKVEEALRPEGKPPRAHDDSALLDLQAALLARLTRAQDDVTAAA